MRERVGGDLFSIVVTEPYSDNYDECLDRAASVALTRDYPEYFAAISAMGWMVDLDDKNGKIIEFS